MYLDDFVNDLLDCLENGITINGRNISVKVRCFICDSPARAMIKGIKRVAKSAHATFLAVYLCI